MDYIKHELLQAQSLLDAFIADDSKLQNIEQAGNRIAASFNQNGKVISCGNGGSMSDAIHFAEELTGLFQNHRRSLPAIAISDPGYLSCAANDFGYEQVFSRFIEGMGNSGDVLLAITTSGNSPNVLQAIKTAKQKGLITIGLTGKDGGEAAKLVDIEIRAPYSEYSDRTQEIHIKIIHALISFIERKVTP